MIRAFCRWLGIVPCFFLGSFLLADDSKPAPPPLPTSDLETSTLVGLKAFLRDWYAANSNVIRMDIRFELTIYDPVIGVEKMGRGLASVDRFGQCFYRVDPIRVGTGQRGRRYAAAPAEAVRWHVTHDSIIKVNDVTKSFERIFIPIEDRGSSATLDTSLAQFLIVRRPEAIQERFQISIEKQSDKDVMLKFVPLTAAMQANYSQILMIVERENYLPKGIKVFDTTGKTERVYFATEIKCNQPPSDPFGDLAEPDLKGYRQVIAPGMPVVKKPKK